MNYNTLNLLAEKIARWRQQREPVDEANYRELISQIRQLCKIVDKAPLVLSARFNLRDSGVMRLSLSGGGVDGTTFKSSIFIGDIDPTKRRPGPYVTHAVLENNLIHALAVRYQAALEAELDREELNG